MKPETRAQIIGYGVIIFIIGYCIVYFNPSQGPLYVANASNQEKVIVVPESFGATVSVTTNEYQYVVILFEHGFYVDMRPPTETPIKIVWEES